MGSEQSPVEAAIDRTLRAADQSLRKSHEVLRALNGILAAQQGALVAAEHTLARAGRLLDHVDIDIAALETRPADVAKSPARDAEPVRVLIVDDSEPIRRVLETMLTVEFDDRVEIRIASDGHAAIDAAPWRPAVVILDWQMPGIDGLETARRLRPLLADTRIVMYSAQPAAAGADLALAAGADAYIEKGVDPSGLLAHVATVVNGVPANAS
jgi:CheY-like chemotaxis protein